MTDILERQRERQAKEQTEALGFAPGEWVQIDTVEGDLWEGPLRHAVPAGVWLEDGLRTSREGAALDYRGPIFLPFGRISNLTVGKEGEEAPP